MNDGGNVSSVEMSATMNDAHQRQMSGSSGMRNEVEILSALPHRLSSEVLLSGPWASMFAGYTCHHART